MEDQQFKLTVGVTDAGKELQIVRDTMTNMFQLQYSTGGEIPSELRDPWNNLEMLKVRAESYIANLSKKKAKNA